jgi:hypothetical protein
VVILLGLYPVALALGVLPGREESLHAPVWVGVLAGSVIVIAGVMILLGPVSRMTSLLAAAVCLSLSAIGGWVALFAPSSGLSGGVPFASRTFNVSVGRLMFGFGAVVVLGLAVFAFRQAVSPPAGRRAARTSERREE